jgi:hypothetical protein
VFETGRPLAQTGGFEASIPVYEIFRSGAGISAPDISDGITKMIMSKIAIAFVGVSIGVGLLLTFAPAFSADVALAVVACF